jgi:hypothetical protein
MFLLWFIDLFEYFIYHFVLLLKELSMIIVTILTTL